jgi:hypothetical protein
MARILVLQKRRGSTVACSLCYSQLDVGTFGTTARLSSI